MNRSVAAAEAPRTGLEGCPLEFDPRLVEDAVLLAIERQEPEVQRRFRRQRDPLYEIAEPDVREEGFHALNARWFVELALDDPLHRALEQEPSVAAGVSRCLVVPVVRARQEYADLKPDPQDKGPPTLLLALRVTTLVDRDGLLPFLWRELLHIADMLDPDFGFEPELPLLEGSAPLANVLRQRYRVLWDTAVDGRLATRDQLAPGGKEARRREFLSMFSMLGESGEQWFEDFFRDPRASHAEFVAFATRPGRDGEADASGQCWLCRMPTTSFHPKPTALPTETLAAIRGDFPDWEPACGLCTQCAGLYGALAPPAHRR